MVYPNGNLVFLPVFKIRTNVIAEGDVAIRPFTYGLPVHKNLAAVIYSLKIEV